MIRSLLTVVLALSLANIACGGGSSPVSTPTPAAPTPSVEPAPEVPEGTAVILSLGDFEQPGCCNGDQRSQQSAFAEAVSQRLNRPVQYVTLARDITATEMIAGVGGQKPSQLDRAVAAIKQYQQAGHPVVAVTLSIGAKDFEQVRSACGQPGSTACADQLPGLLDRFRQQLIAIYGRLNQALQSPTPILNAGYYDYTNCSGTEPADSSSSTVGAFNGVVATEAVENAAFFVDVTDAMIPGACGLNGYPSAAGYAAIDAKYIDAYGAVGSTYVEPFVLP